MNMSSEQELLQRLIFETVTMLCRNTYSDENSSLQVQGLIGVTINSNVFIVHFDEKFDSSSLKESSESKAGCSNNLDLCAVNSHADSDVSDEIPIPTQFSRSKVRESCARRTWSQEVGRERGHRRNPVQPIAGDTSVSDVIDCDLVKEETCRVAPGFPQPWPGFQDGQTESSTIPEGGSCSQITLNLETDLIESETAASQTKTIMSRSSRSSMVVPGGNRYVGASAGDGGSSFQPSFSTTEFVGMHQTTRRSSQGKYRKSFETRDSEKVITKSLHICAYPSCGKQFHHRHHLLRHQTMKHNRSPTKRRGLGFALSSASSSQPLESCYDSDEQGYDE